MEKTILELFAEFDELYRERNYLKHRYEMMDEDDEYFAECVYQLDINSQMLEETWKKVRILTGEIQENQ